jgi:cobalamin biosynthesis protein CbiD
MSSQDAFCRRWTTGVATAAAKAAMCAAGREFPDPVEVTFAPK